MSALKFAKLGDVALYIRGINFKPDDVVTVGTAGTVACMRTKNIQESLDCSDVWGIAESFVRRPEQILQKGDILISSANSWNLVGKCCWIPDLAWKSTFGGFVSALRANKSHVEPRFLYWWFSSDWTQALLRSFGQKTTNISNLNAKRCLNLDIPLPTLPEQRRIAAILDKADALRAKRREALAQLDTLTQSIFIEMFGDPISNPKNWLIQPLSQCAKQIQIGPFGTQLHEEDYIDGGIPLINPTHLRGGIITPDPSLTVSPEKYAELTNYYLLSGDLIMGRRGEMGRCVVITQREHGWLCGTGSLFVRPKTDVLHPTYLGFVISSPSMRHYLENVAQGVTMANLNKTIVGGLPIAVPPMVKQQAFVSHLNSTQAIKNRILASLSGFNALFFSLQDRAFKGEL